MPVRSHDPKETNQFPDWRLRDEASLHYRLNGPFEGMAFDIEHNSFWPEEWGPKPSDPAEAIEIARRRYDAAPKLIPIYGHRYIPAEPHEAGNPVLSVHQTDIIYYGRNLWDYFEQEFGGRNGGGYVGQRYAGWTSGQYQAAHKRTRFWSDHVG